MTTENVFDTGPCLFDHITCTKRYMNNMLRVNINEPRCTQSKQELAQQ